MTKNTPKKLPNTKNASSIGIIGGADGPTAIFFTNNKKLDKAAKKQEAYLERAKELAVPCLRGIDELPAFLAERFAAVEYEPDEREKNVLKTNILLNKYRELLNLPDPPAEGASEEEWIDYHKNDDSFERARNYPDEGLGFVYRAFSVPEKTVRALMKKERGFFRRFASRRRQRGDAWIKYEQTTEYLQMSGGCSAIIEEIDIFLGVSEQDILNTSPRFVAYAYAMRNQKRWK